MGRGGGHALGQSVRETGETGGRGRRRGRGHGNAVTTPNIRVNQRYRKGQDNQISLVFMKNLWEVVRY